MNKIARGRKFCLVLEDVSDCLVIEEERPKASQPLRDYIAERERKKLGKVRMAR